MAGIDTSIEAARKYIIKRPRLTRLLDNANAKVLMLIAPAGFGKTTLAREWVADRPHVWYRGTAATADVAALAAGFADTISEVIPEAGSRAIARMRAAGTPEEEVAIIADLFAEDLVDWPSDLWLVFDDYHFAMEARAPERFVDLLVRKSPIKVLLASRKRPTWASARRLLYGELYELGRNELAMDHDEAASVLAHRKDAPAAGLVALAEGWPAVIGLAALTDEIDLPDRGLPDALYDYFAEEVYQTAPLSIQDGLRRLALAPSLRDGIAEFLLGDDAEAVISEGLRLGFLTSRSGSLEIHPLLRAFLDSKRRRASRGAPLEIERLVRHLADVGAWDDAFTVVGNVFSAHLLTALLEAGLPSLLRQARLSTVTRWLELARLHRIDDPIVDLAEAEIAFCDARFHKSEAFASRAARRLPSDHSMRSRAYYIAGSSAHLHYHHDRAKAFFDQALETAKSTRSVRDALWGELITSLDLDLPEAVGFHDQLLELNDGLAETELKLAMARLQVACRKGQSLASAAEAFESTAHLLPLITDPLVVSAFKYSQPYLHILRAEYDAALRTATECEQYAREVKFSLLHIYSRRVRAMAEFGVRHFGRCKQLVDSLEREADASKDVFLRAEARIGRARLLLAEGRVAEATDCLSRLPSRFPFKGEHAEWVATLALVFACGRRPEALRYVDESEAISEPLEVKALNFLTRAIVELAGDHPRAVGTAIEAYSAVRDLGALDSFVVAYRACPALLEAVLKEADHRESVAVVLENAHDWALAKKVGLPVRERRPRHLLLSPREQEVLGLVAQGLTNREIAKALYLSESTAKVHVRHILEKLGVRSRTEAALRAAELAELD